MKTVVYSNRLTILHIILNCRSWKSLVTYKYVILLLRVEPAVRDSYVNMTYGYTVSWWTALWATSADWTATDTHRWVKQQLTVGMGESLRQPITTTPYHCRVTVETCDTERPTGQLRLTKIMATPLESLRQIVRQEICNCWPCTSHICDICKAFIKSWEILDPLILRRNYINCIHLYPTYHFLPC